MTKPRQPQTCSHPIYARMLTNPPGDQVFSRCYVSLSTVFMHKYPHIELGTQCTCALHTEY